MAKVYRKKNGKFVIVNEFLEELPVDNVDMLFPFSNDIATFRVNSGKGKKFGYMNVNGEKITNDVYDHAENFGINYGIVKNGSKQNLIDRNGNEIFDWKYTKIDPFLNGTFIVQNVEGYYGLVDASDKILLGFIYQDLISITHEARRKVMK